MLRIRYRNKLRFKKFGRALLIVLVLVVLVGIAVLAYADSIMYYDRDGAHLHKPQTTQPTETQPQERPSVPDPTIVVQEGFAETVSVADMGGVYITTNMLQDLDRVTELLKGMDEPCAVMIELKSIFGNYYYSSSFANGNHPDGIDIAAIDALITYLKDNGFYLIASLPAFRDRAYGLEQQSCGLPLSSGALWEDDRGCYWLDPANDAVISRLMQLTRELAGKGFDEVAFTEFRFPDTDSISYSSDKSRTQIIQEAVAELSGFFVGSETTVSFVTEGTVFPADQCSGRLYIPNVDGSQVEGYASAYAGSETLGELVFLANSRDTRFEGRAVLRPLMAE